MSTPLDAPPSEPAGRRRASLARTDRVALGLVLAVGIVGFLVWRGSAPGPETPKIALSTGAARRLMAQRPHAFTRATLDLMGTPAGETAVIPEGAAVPLSFRVDVDSRPLVLEERSNFEIALLFPPPGRPSVVVPALRRISVEDPRGGTYVVREPAGPRRVRLVVFPPEVDPLAIQPVELSRLLPRLTIVERLYVAAPRETSDE